MSAKNCAAELNVRYPVMEQYIDKFVIPSKGKRKDKGYIGCLSIFWIIWTPATAVVTYGAFTEFRIFLMIWLIFGYAGVVLIPLCLLGINKPQVLLFNGEHLIVKGTGWPFGKAIHVGRDEIEALTLEHYDGPGTEDTESVWSLNLFLKRTYLKKRIMLAQFLHPEEKVELFWKIKDFLEGHGFNFETKNNYKPKNTEHRL